MIRVGIDGSSLLITAERGTPSRTPLNRANSAMSDLSVTNVTNVISAESPIGSHVNGDRRAASQTPDGPKPRVKKVKMDRGGSIAVLRRKIIMDIVEKAGGVFPQGTELWYPFTTAWTKMKHKEEPDLRTILA